MINDETVSAPTVNVLLSVFKPDFGFFEMQLQSILGQKNVRVKLHIRIDGFDLTTENFIRNRMQYVSTPFKLYHGERIGPAGSFLELVRVSNSHEYIAFADQDDIWAPNKLSSALRYFNEEQVPTLVIAGMVAIDKNGNPLPERTFFHEGKPKCLSFKNAIVENQFQGARMVINPKGVELLQNHFPDYRNVIMHDAWTYLAISAFGDIRIQNESTFFYRQHSNNLIGLSSNSFLNRVSRFRATGNVARFKMAEEFLRVFPNYRDSKFLMEFISLPHRSRIARMFSLMKLRLQREKVRDLIMLYIAIMLMHRE